MNSKGAKYFFFESFDAVWKVDDFDEEWHWGIATADRSLKPWILDQFICTKESYEYNEIKKCNGQAYPSEVYNCTDGVLLCPRPLVGCGKVEDFSCYDPKLYKCVAGVLSQA